VDLMDQTSGEIVQGSPGRLDAHPGMITTAWNLDHLARDPSALHSLPVPALLDLRRKIRHLDADIELAIERVRLRDQRQTDIGEVMDVGEAARRLNTSADSLYRKHNSLRLGYIDPLDGRLKFTGQEISEYIRRRQRS
jgi:hypothetical protein